MIRVQNLTAGHDRVAVVRNLDLEVNEGELVGLFGPNGAGKTTTLLTIAGLLPPIAGRVQVFGTVVTGKRSHRIAHTGLALVPEGRGVFHQLTVAENLRIHRLRSSRVTLDDVLDRFPELRRLLGRRAGLLSGGEQQMLAIGSALIADPRMLMVDELSLGLAPLVVERLLAVLKEIAHSSNIGVLLVEQHVHAALEIANRAYVLANGRLTYSGPAEVLRADHSILTDSYLGGDLAATMLQ